MEAGEKLKEEVRTPLEAYRDELKNVEKLYKGGFIDKQTFGRR